MPKPNYLKEFSLFILGVRHASAFHTLSHRIFSNQEEEPMLTYGGYIQSHTNQTDCIYKLYGWDAGETYYYGKRKPCSKYILSNIIGRKEAQTLKQDLLDHPPSLFVYSDRGSDMDTSAFNAMTLPFPNIIHTCYNQDLNHQKIYLKKGTQEELKQCWQTVAQTPETFP